MRDPFWKKVDIRGANECWLWLSHVTRNGYGETSRNYQRWGAHRLAWTLVNGEIPSEMFVCHTCDNPRCVNPSHLFLGTARDNARDRERKGRGADVRGELNAGAKLSEARVKSIRRQREKGVPIADLARRHGVSKAAISLAANRKTWAHI